MDCALPKYFFPAPEITKDNTLIYYDGPLLVLANVGDDGHRIMAVALLSSKNQDPYLVVEITPEQEARLLNNTVTLRALCLECQPPHGLGVYYLTEYYAPVWELTALSEIIEDYLPGDVPLQPVESGSA